MRIYQWLFTKDPHFSTVPIIVMRIPEHNGSPNDYTRTNFVDLLGLRNQSPD